MGRDGWVSFAALDCSGNLAKRSPPPPDGHYDARHLRVPELFPRLEQPARPQLRILRRTRLARPRVRWAGTDFVHGRGGGPLPVLPRAGLRLAASLANQPAPAHVDLGDATSCALRARRCTDDAQAVRVLHRRGERVDPAGGNVARRGHEQRRCRRRNGRCLRSLTAESWCPAPIPNLARLVQLDCSKIPGVRSYWYI